jgi:CII-binding regulator of phage lambda lysogenization HflD
MESLKRKLSTTRRPSTADRNLLPELNQYKQNNAALQTQISSLMAKLNESKKSEKALKATLQDVEKRCEDAERKTSEAEELASSARALQNTIDHLENRLEIANTEKLDAQEELFNMRALKSPFDASFPELQDAHESMDTVFSSDSYTERRRDSGATVAQYIAHMEHLEDDVRHKDAYIADLEGNCDQLRQMLDHVNQQYDEMSEQFDMQNELLGKTEESDAQIEQLRAAVVDREVVIAEKEKSVRAVEKQLEHHKLLLHAEIRKHATTSRYLSDNSNPLPELSSLASKKEIDGWIQKLHQRLRKVKPMSPARAPATAAEAQIEDLRNEIDFYVREIIYYKLDIRGYKSDIKKLNKVMAQLGSYGNRSDLDSDTSSLRPAPTPRTRFTSTPELKGSERPSPAQNGIVSANMASVRALTPPLSATADSTSNSPTLEVRTASDSLEEAASRIPIASQASTKITIINATRDSPTTNVIQRHDTQRSLSDSTFQMYKSAVQADEPSDFAHDDHVEMLALAMGHPGKPFIHAVKPERMSNSSRPTIERAVSETSTVRPVIPMSKFSRDAPFNPHTTAPQQVPRPRAGSGSSVLTYSVQTQSTSPRTERHMSGASSTSVPFVIAMASPHNPAIAVAAKNMPATRSHKPNSSTSRPTSRAGLDGTMASSTPLPSPASFRSTSPMTANPSTGYKRRLSLSFRKQENQAPATPMHSRSLSGGSIRTAIRWTKGGGRDREKEKEKEKERKKEGQVRKDSAQPLGSPMEWQDIGLDGGASGAHEVERA